MKRRLAMIVCLAAFSAAGCQQSQDADEPGSDTVVKDQTVVKEPSQGDGADVKMDVQAKTGSGGTSADVQVKGETK
jgi:hypothetical protein